MSEEPEHRNTDLENVFNRLHALSACDTRKEGVPEHLQSVNVNLHAMEEKRVTICVTCCVREGRETFFGISADVHSDENVMQSLGLLLSHEQALELYKTLGDTLKHYAAAQ